MKLNKFLMAFAAVAMVGCSSEDVMDFSANQAPEDSRMIQLDENFAIAGVSTDDGVTRTHWEQSGTKLVNKFLPILNADAAVDDVLDTKVDKFDQAVGLCWLGQTPGAEVYTNYQFYHFGWLKQGEDNATIECTKLTNGAWYDEIKFTAANAAGEADQTKFAFVDPAAKDFAITALNYNSGVYKTDNKSIFGGDYIVYYPFNEDFNEVGTIPAEATTAFNPVPTTLTDPALGYATFRYSNKVHIDGGSQAGGFGLKNLSSLVRLKVSGNSGKTIDQIVLWSKKEQILKQAKLDATKILAGKEGTELYDETEGSTVGAKTIVATLGTAHTVTTANPANAYVTALPTTVEDLVVFVHSQDKKWATINVGKKEFEAGGAALVEVSPKASDFKTNFIAVDETSLNQALTDAAGLTATIEVIGDITLTTNRTINEPNITIKGDAIIVPENVTLTLNTKMESDIRVLGKACCTDPALSGGRLTINGGTISNVTMEPAEATITGTAPATYENYNPLVTYQTAAATVAAGKTFDAQAGNILVNAAVAHKANINIAEGVKVTVSATGDLNFMGATVVNNGTIEVEKAGTFDITDKDGNASAEDGKNMTNNGEFIHNVDANVGTAVQLMQQNGVYRCRVHKQEKLYDAYQKWLACSVIEIVGTAGNTEPFDLGVAEKTINYQHNGKYIDIEVNTTGVTYFNNPDDGSGNGDNKNIQVGKLTVLNGGLNVTYVKGDGKRELTVNDDMTLSASARLASSKMITVKKNIIVNNGAMLRFMGKKTNEGGLAVSGDITVSGTGSHFNAGDQVDALNITCTNFTLADGAQATFGNRTEGDTKNMTVSETITNGTGCTFTIVAANQEGGSLLATITCTKLIVGGDFTNGKPQVVAK